MKTLVYTLLPTLVLGVAVFFLMKSRIPTHLKVDLTADRAVFTVGGTDEAYGTEVLNSVSFESITIEKFARIDLSPEKLQIADPDIQSEPPYPESAWTSLTVIPPVVITGEEERLQPSVNLENTKAVPVTMGNLDRISVRQGSQVTLEVGASQKLDLTIKVEQYNSSAVLSIHEPFQIMIDKGRISGITHLPYDADLLTFRAQLPNYNPHVKITGQPRSLVLTLTISPEKSTEVFPKGGIPVTELDFTRQNSRGDRETTLVKDGEITYPDYPTIEKVSFKASDFIRFQPLDKFCITQIALDPEHKGIRFLLEGIVKYARSGSFEFQKDHRLTRFTTLRENSQLAILATIIAWLFTTTVAGCKLYKELKGS